MNIHQKNFHKSSRSFHGGFHEYLYMFFCEKSLESFLQSLHSQYNKGQKFWNAASGKSFPYEVQNLSSECHGIPPCSTTAHVTKATIFFF